MNFWTPWKRWLGVGLFLLLGEVSLPGVGGAEVPSGVRIQRPGYVTSEFGKPTPPLCLKESCRTSGSEEGDILEDRLPASQGPTNAFVQKPELMKPDPDFRIAGAPLELAVIATESGFFPATLSVVQGTPLKLYLTSTSLNTELCFVMDAFHIYRGLPSQRVVEISFTPKEAGIFPFSCPVRTLQGSLVVRELGRGN